MADTATRVEPGPQVAPVFALSTNEVNVGTPNGPGIYLAPEGTAGPVDTIAAWPAAWNILGYTDANGPTVGQNTTKQDLTAWQSMAPLRSVITAREMTLHFVLWQLNELTLALYFDCDQPTADVSGNISMDVVTAKSGHRYAVGVDTSDGGRALRVIYPHATLSDSGDMPIQRGAVVPLECTLTALESAGKMATILLGPDRTGG